MYTVSRKVPGGKLIRLRCGVAAGRIVSAQLSGDFFVMPATSIKFLEAALTGILLSEPSHGAQSINEAITKHSIQVAGFNAEDVALLIAELRTQLGGSL